MPKMRWCASKDIKKHFVLPVPSILLPHPLMINSNADIEKKLAMELCSTASNSSSRKGEFLGEKLGRSQRLNSVHCDHILCEYWPRKPDESPRSISKKQFTIHCSEKKRKIGLVTIIQFGVTTGHNLQGTSKDNVIVKSYYKIKQKNTNILHITG